MKRPIIFNVLAVVLSVCLNATHGHYQQDHPKATALRGIDSGTTKEEAHRAASPSIPHRHSRALFLGWNWWGSTDSPTSTPSTVGLLGDSELCSTSDQCQSGCCSSKYSYDGLLKCTFLNKGFGSDICIISSDPGGSRDQTPPPSPLPLRSDWDFCTADSQCSSGCCSAGESTDGRLKCTPLDHGFLSEICLGNGAGGSQPPTPVSTASHPVGGTCGNGTVGDGVCDDGTCCSPYGYCGTTPEHCDSTAPPTPWPSCGDGERGNGICPNGMCCSWQGWCGTTIEYCESVPPPVATDSSPFPITTVVICGTVVAVLAVILIVFVCERKRGGGINPSHFKPTRSGFTVISAAATTITEEEFNSFGGHEISQEPRPTIWSNYIQHSGLDMTSSDDIFLAHYEQGRVLGQGSQGKVFECRKKPDRGEMQSFEKYAVKRVATTSSVKAMEYLQNEIKVLVSLGRNNYTVQLYGVIEGPPYTYMVMELLSGGDINGWIRKNQLFSEADAQKLCKRLFEAIRFCHQKEIAHRDIKLANLLLGNKDDMNSVKIADFGFAKVVPKDGLTTKCGTPCYIAPEIILTGSLEVKSYDKQCDMWSVGVVVYQLLVGETLFVANPYLVARKRRIQDLYRKIVASKLPFNESNAKWLALSDHAKAMLCNLLNRNPKDRWSAQQALDCAWIKASTERMDSKRMMDISCVEEELVYDQRPSILFLPSYEEEEDEEDEDKL